MHSLWPWREGQGRKNFARTVKNVDQPQWQPQHSKRNSKQRRTWGETLTSPCHEKSRTVLLDAKVGALENPREVREIEK